ncbi:MAG: D-sedoheptulose-7-phosphate isomerase [Gemmatimonadota bacterium]
MTDARSLYPFLNRAPAESSVDAEALLGQVRASTLQKAADAVELRRSIAATQLEAISAAAIAIAGAFGRGGKLLAFGNGGSATDAMDAVADCTVPPVEGWRALPAISLVGDPAVLTGLANDVGFENVFRRQLIAFAAHGDVALGFSTSGGSANVLAAFDEARRRGMITVALAGYDGGELAAGGVVDHCIISPSEHVPRIQEGHATIWHALLEMVQELLSEPGEGLSR